MIKQIGIGYLIVLLFLIIFVAIISIGPRLHREMGQPAWAVTISFILVLPLFMPLLIRNVWPRVTGIKIPNILELTFARLQEPTYATEELHNQLKQFTADSLNLSEFTNERIGDIREIEDMIISAEGIIARHVDEIKKNRFEVIIIDLKRGNAWLYPNLFFLVFLLLKRTDIKQILLLETRDQEEEFLGMSSPQEVLQGIGRAFPECVSAANSVSFSGLESVPQYGGFFDGLSEWMLKITKENSQKLWVSSSELRRIMRELLHLDNIESSGSLSLDNYKSVVSSPNLYIAVLEDNKVSCVINRDKAALKIAQELIKQAS